MTNRVLVVGAGIFGVTAAVEMRRRGWEVILMDPGPVPHPLAASTDISKAVRMEYGADLLYVELMEESIEGWKRWNADFGTPLFHQTGTLYMRRSPLKPGDFEYESWNTLRQRGHPVERIDSATLRQRFPAWNADLYLDGTFNPAGGFAESSKVVLRLLQLAGELGVEIREHSQFQRLVTRESNVAGILLADGSTLEADMVVLTVGAWTPHLLPELSGAFKSVGMPVFHLKPDNPELYQAARFPKFGADISNTGYYGFPVNPDGIVKIANHGRGREMHPESPERVVTQVEIAALCSFVKDTFPSLAGAEIVYTRICLYCDSVDGHFWIAADPHRPGLVVATGDSGHAFKFAPALGKLIADAVEQRPHPALNRFRWRPDLTPTGSGEAARPARHEASGSGERVER